MDNCLTALKLFFPRINTVDSDRAIYRNKRSRESRATELRRSRIYNNIKNT